MNSSSEEEPMHSFSHNSPHKEEKKWEINRIKQHRSVQKINAVTFRFSVQMEEYIKILRQQKCDFNTLNAELNPICHLLALLGVHFLHVSRIRIKSLTLRLLMSYIYIWSTYS